MTAPLTLAIPSKGRLKEQVDGWLSDCGLRARAIGGARGYLAELEGLPCVHVRLASAGDIAASLAAGDIHLGVTGEDLLAELRDAGGSRVLLLNALGFGRADLVVAAPKSWIDVNTMSDVDDVAHAYLARTGRRLRVATKYLVQARAFFARHGVVDYRLVESGGATEGAPAAGLAELIVDITSTGDTLAANSLKVLDDGVILRSQAHLAASPRADWDETSLSAAGRLLSIVEARARGRSMASLIWPAAQDAVARAAVAAFVQHGDAPRANGLLVKTADVFAATTALARAGVGPVSVTHPTYVFEAVSAAADRLADAIARGG
jgi:ATP phosphoribosyltransferase